MKLVRSPYWKRCFPFILAAIARGRVITWHSLLLAAYYRWSILIAAIFTACLGVWAWHNDENILRLVHVENPVANQFARFCSYWGDYQTYSVPFAILLWINSALLRVPSRRRHWRRVAMACFIGASLTGLFNDAFRLTMGRPRPSAVDPAKGIVDTFYGPRFTWWGDYQSFPSGHAATSFGTATALLIINPPIGTAATVFAASVCWARMDLRRHYPSDIAVGMMVGIIGGLLVGRAATGPLPKR